MDTQAKIACCKICLLAEVMKDCKHCAFNVGLTAKAQAGQEQNKPKEEQAVKA